MRERPIIFSAPMVRALLAGRKTMTRRLIKPQPVEWAPGILASTGKLSRFAVGDRLWVREAWRTESPECDGLAPSDLSAGEPLLYDADADWSLNKSLGRSRNPLHMPRWASRLTLTVTAITVERLHDISEADAMAEGATSRPKCSGFRGHADGWSMDWSVVGRRTDPVPGSARMAFVSAWNEIHGDSGPASWAANPWVEAIRFAVDKRGDP